MSYVILDVREPDEYTRGHVLGALNVPSSELLAGATKLAELPKQAPLLIYCRSGARAQAVMDVLRDLGFDDVTNGINQKSVEKMLLTA